MHSENCCNLNVFLKQWHEAGMVSEPSDFNLLTQKDFSDQVKMNNEPLQSGSTHNRQHVCSMIEFRKLRFHFLFSL